MNNQIEQEFIVTARKWRPQLFSAVVGQNHITETLMNAIKSGRVHHAYLFCGPRGVGKTTTARIFARALNCTSPIDFEPCNVCESCRSILNDHSLDVIEIDGASNNSVEDIRILRENVKYPPSAGKYKIYIIDEVHMLSKQAFNALLKTLEEPPKHLIFIFATTEAHKVLPTIISRCQRFDFRRMEIENIVGQLQFVAKNEEIQIDEESLYTIAKKSDGSMRDSQSIFDQAVAFCGKNIEYKSLSEVLNLIDEEFYFKITEAAFEKDSAKMLKLTQEVMQRGYDLQETLQGLLEHLRNIIAIKLTNNEKLVESSQAFIEKYKESAEKFERLDLIRMMNLLSTAEQQLRFVSQPRIRFELALLQLSSIGTVSEIDELINEIRALSSIELPAGDVDNKQLEEKKKSELEVKQTTFKNIDVKLEQSQDLLAKAPNNEKIAVDIVHPIENYLIENFKAVRSS